MSAAWREEDRKPWTLAPRKRWKPTRSSPSRQVSNPGLCYCSCSNASHNTYQPLLIPWRILSGAMLPCPSLSASAQTKEENSGSDQSLLSVERMRAGRQHRPGLQTPNGTVLGESTTIKQKCKHTLGTSSLESSLGDTLAASLFQTPWVMENAFHKVQAEHHTGFPTNYQPVNSLQGGSGSRAMRMD